MIELIKGLVEHGWETFALVCPSEVALEMENRFSPIISLWLIPLEVDSFKKHEAQKIPRA